MIDENGKITNIDLDTARTKVLEQAKEAGVDVTVGSVEYVISEWLARNYYDVDTSIFLTINKFFYPTGSDLDVQNLGIPRLTAQKSKGFLEVDNSLNPMPVTYTVGTVFTSPTNVEFTLLETVTISANAKGFLSVESVNTGTTSNIPALQNFQSGTPSILNPQPIIGGREIENDTEYFNRITFLKTNITSSQASVAITVELLKSYIDARVYVNNSANGTDFPISIPASGYNCVVIFPSGVNPSSFELQKAIEALTEYAEFVGVNNVSSVLHPIVYGTIFTGVFPVAYSVTPAQSVKTTLELEVTVKFDSGIIELEKNQLAEQFANNFVNRLQSTFYSTDGNYNYIFEPLSGDDTIKTLPVLGVVKPSNILAPYVSIEAIRSIIYDQSDSISLKGIQYKNCNNLTIEFDSLELGEIPITLSIFAPLEGTLLSLDFAKDICFSDESSWYDRYIVLDPSLFTVKIIEET